MKKSILSGAALLALLLNSCTMTNPLLTESTLPYGAPQFDKIKNCHYMPAFERGIAENKSEIDAIIANQDAPTFENTILAMEESGALLDKVSSIFFNILEADTDDEKQNIAEEVSPKLTELSMYISLNRELFAKVKAVYDGRDTLGLEPDQLRLLEKTYKGFVNSGALLEGQDREEYAKLEEEISLLSLQFGKNALAATNAYTLDITDEADLAGLPQFVRDLGAQTAIEKGRKGWTFDLSHPSYGPFMKYSEKRELRHQMYTAYNTRSVGGEFDNSATCARIAFIRLRIANLLGYDSYAAYATDDRMVGSEEGVRKFMDELFTPSIKAARKEVAEILAFAKENGFEGEQLMPWDFSFWSEKYKDAKFDLSDEMLKPYFQLESCIDAVFGLATKLYGITFEERKDIPGYHKDVKVFDVKDADGTHLALFYTDFFPRESKRGGAWMTEFRGQKIVNGVEYRPFVSIVTNFSKPTADDPSLLTHDELTTFLHEFGHSLHGMLTQGRYGSLLGTSVDHDFVELPSQIMENWAFEPEYLMPFAKHYQTGESIPQELIDKIVESKNYLAAYAQVRQLQYGFLDMAWHSMHSFPEGLGDVESVVAFEKDAVGKCAMIASVDGTAMSPTFNHIFSGGYAAGYYSYKWAEVLAADAFSLFKEKGIFNTVVSQSFRDNVLSKGSTEDEATLYRRFRGHDPEPKALLESLGIPVK